MKRHISDEADARLAFYLALPEEAQNNADMPARPQLPPGVLDTPLVRVYNFLRMSNRLKAWSLSTQKFSQEIMSLSYQLEILWYQVVFLKKKNQVSRVFASSYAFFQAQRMRSLGWADYLTIEMTQNRKVMTVSYWM